MQFPGISMFGDLVMVREERVASWAHVVPPEGIGGCSHSKEGLCRIKGSAGMVHSGSPRAVRMTNLATEDLSSRHRETVQGWVGLGVWVTAEQIVQKWILRSEFMCVFSSLWWLWLVLQPIPKYSRVNKVYASDLANSLHIKLLFWVLWETPTSLNCKLRATFSLLLHLP